MRTILTTMVAFLGLASMSLGQKSAPTPLANDAPRGPDLKAFDAIYQAAGEPRILVLVNPIAANFQRGGGIGQAPGASADIVGNVGRNVPAGVETAVLDTTGVAEMLKQRIEETLLAADAQVVSLDAMAERDRREFALLKARNLEEAARLLATKVNADLVLNVRMLASDAVNRQGARYRVTFETLKVASGSKITGYAFDWREGTTAEWIKAYANEITTKWFNQLGEQYLRPGGDAMRYAVRLIGVRDVAALRHAEQAMGKMPGVKKVIARQTATGSKDAVAEFDLRYQGSLLSLAADLQEFASKELGMVVDTGNAVQGSLTLIARAGQPPGPWREMIKADSELLKKFQEAYVRRGSPRVAVMVNREYHDRDRRERDAVSAANPTTQSSGAGTVAGAGGAASSAGAMVTINFAPNGIAANTGGTPGGDGAGVRTSDRPARRWDADPLDSRRMEDYLFKRMIKPLRITAIDPNAARAKLADEIKKETAVFEENELVFLLSRAADAEVVIHGVGRMRTAAPGVAEPKVQDEIVYTFRAVNPGTGAVIAADGVSIPLEDHRLDDAGLEAAADYIAGNLAVQMLEQWTPPTNLTVTVSNVRTAREVAAIMNFFQDKLGVRNLAFKSHESGKEGGLGVFTCQYMSPSNELVDAITKIRADELPFALEAHSITPETISFKLREAN